MFHGALTDADVTIQIADGTLSAWYKGRFSRVDPAVALDDPRFASVMTGAADVQTTVRDLLTGTPELPDYEDLRHRNTGRVEHPRRSDCARGLSRGAACGQLEDCAAHSSGACHRRPCERHDRVCQRGATALDYDITRLDAGDITHRAAGVASGAGLTGQGIVATKRTPEWPVHRAACRRRRRRSPTSTPPASRRSTSTVTTTSTVAVGRLRAGHCPPLRRVRRFRWSSASRSSSFPDRSRWPASGSAWTSSLRKRRDAPAQSRATLFVDSRSPGRFSSRRLRLTFGNAPWQLSHGPTLPTVAWNAQGARRAADLPARRRGTGPAISNRRVRGATTGAAR